MDDIGRNDDCPCGSGLKYKKCCEGEVDWPAVLRADERTWLAHLSARGKNMVFLKKVGEAIGLQTGGTYDWTAIKERCTPPNVRRIYEIVCEIWPDASEVERVLKIEKQHTTGLYIGTYDPATIMTGITRHCLYTDSILLVDPFLHPRLLRPEFNPLENPAAFQQTTLKTLWLWMSLSGWIESGLIKFVRTPTDFDLQLFHEACETSQRKYDQDPELRAAMEQYVVEYEDNPEIQLLAEEQLLYMSDEQIVENYRKFDPNATEEKVARVVEYLSKRRKEHPYHLPIERIEEAGMHQYIFSTTGTSYEIAKITASITHSHLITDIAPKWKEIEIDRRDSGVRNEEWTPLAKAFQNLQFKFLNKVPLDFALTLRKQDKLSRMREFLGRVWRKTEPDQPFDERASVMLADELTERIAEADDEWKRIDQELWKWTGMQVSGTIATAAPAIANGYGAWLAAATAVAGITNIAVSQSRKKVLFQRYPAAFLLSLKKTQTD